MSIVAACKAAPPAPESRQVVLAVEFDLAVGERAELKAQDHPDVRFARVVRDGRCPRRIQCVASLPITLEFVLTQNHTETTFQLETSGVLGAPKRRECEAFGAFALELRRIDPWPEEIGSLQPSDYRARLAFVQGC